MNENRCWVNDVEQIVSFSPISGAKQKEFASRDELMQFVLEIIGIKNYRVR